MFRATLRRLAGVALPGLLAATLAAALAPLGWPFELFAHFRWQLGAATLLLLPVVLPLRRRWMTAAAALAIVLQLAPLAWPRLDEPRFARGCTGPEFRIASVNLWLRNDDPARVLAWLEHNPVDVVVLQEVTPAWRQALAATTSSYPHRTLQPRSDPYGIGVLSRWPISQVESVDFANDGLPSLVATLEVAGRRVQVIALHTHWPVLKHLQLARDQGLRLAAERARDATMPTVLAGDLNLTPYAPAFSRLEHDSRLRDAFVGRLWRPTWQAGFWPLALPIDHVLLPEGVCVVDARIGPAIGSDHRPVAVTLQWR
ncbi:MAG TPA: endonuclease/exonuclease/phosphatase family protein [Steroidobacteraceae bacterium]|nr:endonuclease/exonuclease/phosphatase family protein [Steroidobacteraceae bacterium]